MVNVDRNSRNIQNVRKFNDSDIVCGFFKSDEQVQDVYRAVNDLGLSPNSVQTFAGEDGIRQVDPDGTYGGAFKQIDRTIKKEVGGGLSDFLDQVTGRLRGGEILVTIDVKKDDDKDKLALLLQSKGGDLVKYLSRFYAQDYDVAHKKRKTGSLFEAWERIVNS